MGTKTIGTKIILLGIVSLVIGIAFIQQSFSVKSLIAEGLRAENVVLGLPEEDEEGYVEGNVVDSAAEAQAAQDVLEGHMRGDEGTTYGDTERGSPERATYLDGTTLRNSLNLAIIAFGVTTIALITGIFMIITGIALGGTGLALRRLE